MSAPATRDRPAPVLPVPGEVFDAPGPVVSVYLRTDGALPQAAAEVDLRWRALRAQLSEDGAPPDALTAIDPLIDGAHAAGQTLVAISNSCGLLYAAHLPELPDRDSATVGALPHLIPLLSATQRLLPHVVVVTDRLGAELIAVLPEQADRRATVSGEELHVTRSAPGGWSQRRFQQRAENRWEANAGEVADALTRLTDSTRPRLVVISGDVRAVQFLRSQVPGRVAELLQEVQGDYRTLNEALHRSAKLVQAVAEADCAQLLEDYRREQHSGGRAATGPQATLQALHAGQVDTLLLDPTAADGALAWCGPEPAQVGATAQALHAAGIADPQPGPLADIAVRGCAATAASIRLLPAGTPELAHGGVAALLRYR